MRESSLKPSSLPGISLLGILAIALVMRIAVVMIVGRVFGQEQFVFGDSLSYWTLAESIAEGRPYQYGWEHARCFRTPGYPLILAPLFWLPDSVPRILIARLISAVFGTLAVAFTMILARRVAGPKISFWAGLGAAVYPELLLSGSVVLTEAVFAPLMLAQLIFIFDSRSAPTLAGGRWRAIVAGVLGGAAVLLRPSWSIAIPCLMLVYLLPVGQGASSLYGREGEGINSDPTAPHTLRWGRRVLMASLMGLGCLLIMAPWWARNQAVFHRFVPTSLQTGASLYDGLNPVATGGSDMRGVDTRRLDFLRLQAQEHLSPERAEQWISRLPVQRQDPDYWTKLRSEVTPLWQEIQEAAPTTPDFEVAFDRYLSELAVAWAVEHPETAGRLAFEKAIRTWSPTPGPQWQRYRWAAIALSISFCLLALLVLVGAIRSRGKLAEGWVLVFPALYFTVIHAVFVGSIRYREPALYGLMVLAAIGVASVVDRLSLGNAR